MQSIRAIRAKVRRDLHERAKVPAFYISPLQGTLPRLIAVRLHTKYDQTGLLRNDKDYMERREQQPRVLVFNDQVRKPRGGGIFSFAKGEAYVINATDAPDGETRWCYVTAIPVGETTNLPYPVDTEAPTTPTPDPEEGGPSKSNNRLTIPIQQAATEWVLNHNLGYYPEVLLLDPDGQEFEASVQHVDKNKIIVGPLNPPLPGTAILI